MTRGLPEVRMQRFLCVTVNISLFQKNQTVCAKVYVQIYTYTIYIYIHVHTKHIYVHLRYGFLYSPFCNPSKIYPVTCAHTLAKGKTKIKIMVGSAKRGAPCQVPSLPMCCPRASLIGWMDERSTTLGQPLVGIMIKWTQSLARPFNSPWCRHPDLHWHRQHRTHSRCSHLWKLDCICVCGEYMYNIWKSSNWIKFKLSNDRHIIVIILFFFLHLKTCGISLMQCDKGAGVISANLCAPNGTSTLVNSKS